MKKKILSILIAAFTFAASGAFAQGYDLKEPFAVKAYGNIGLGSGMSLSSNAAMTHSSSLSSVGVDFSYMFWQQKGHSVAVSGGLSYDILSAKLDLAGMNYNYAAGNNADMDGNTYNRFYEISDVEQKVGGGYVSVPIYATYTYRFNEWIGVYASLGIKPGFKASGSSRSFRAKVYSYGVYPEYGNLMMDDDWLNDFGRTTLSDGDVNKPEMSGFNMDFLMGFGAEAKISGPVYASLGFNYCAGVTNIYKKGDSKPLVTYTVADGQKSRSLTELLGKSKISNFGLCIAVLYRF